MNRFIFWKRNDKKNSNGQKHRCVQWKKDVEIWQASKSGITRRRRKNVDVEMRKRREESHFYWMKRKNKLDSEEKNIEHTCEMCINNWMTSIFFFDVMTLLMPTNTRTYNTHVDVYLKSNKLTIIPYHLIKNSKIAW